MGIEEDYFNEQSKQGAREKLGLPFDKKILLFIGRVNDVKGVGILLEAINKIKNKNILLKIIGFGPQEEKFKEYVKKNNLSNVEFLGGVFGEEKMLYLSSCDAFVLASSKEGAPVTVMEAMARNRPSVVTDVGGVRLMIEDNKNGIIIQRNLEDLVRAIKEIINWNKEKISDYAEIYKWNKIIDNTVKDYQAD